MPMADPSSRSYKLFSDSSWFKPGKKQEEKKKTGKGQALTPSALTGIREAIHRHLTSAPLSCNVNILQVSDFVSSKKMFEAKAKLFTKEQNVNPNTSCLLSTGIWRN